MRWHVLKLDVVITTGNKRKNSEQVGRAYSRAEHKAGQEYKASRSGPNTKQVRAEHNA